MSEQNEKSGMGFGSIAGGAAIGTGAAALVNNRISQGATVKAISQPTAEGISKKFVDAVAATRKTVTEKAALPDASDAAKKLATEMQEAQSHLGSLTKLPKAESVTSAVFTKTAEGLHEAEILAGGVSHKISGIKSLPAGAEVGKALDAEAAKKLFEGEKSYFAGLTQKAEGELAKLTRKAGGFGFGFKNMGMGGRTAVIGSAVAFTAAGAYAVHAMFGGKHSNKAAAAEPSQAVARG